MASVTDPFDDDATRLMGRLEFATPRAAWGGEATDFTPLLGNDEMLDYLGSECGIGPLSVVEVEHATAGRRSLDILAETLDGRRVAIENQYGVADHDHLTRGLAYAVAVDARGLVLVAEDHREEFQSVASYLNRVAGLDDEGIKVWLVQVRAVRRIGDTTWSPEFVVMAEPNDWESAQRLRSREHLASLDAFYANCAEQTSQEWADVARSIVNDWLARPNTTEGHDSKNTVALYVDGAATSGRSNVLQLTGKGEYTICRGYLRDTSGAVSDAETLQAVDDQIRTHFPAARWPGRQYFITVTHPDVDAHRRFADWLLDGVLDPTAHRDRVS